MRRLDDLVRLQEQPSQVRHRGGDADVVEQQAAGPVAQLLKINRSKFTRGLEPLHGDARSAKSFKVLTLIYSTDCSPIGWLQSVLKITRFENVFLFFFFLKIRRHVRVGVKLD